MSRSNGTGMGTWDNDEGVEKKSLVSMRCFYDEQRSDPRDGGRKESISTVMRHIKAARSGPLNSRLWLSLRRW